VTVEDRKLQILAAVAERFIETGEPVSSKYVAQLMNNEFSSATIRNDMATLEEIGWLDHMHTSSGRVPTHQGYRTYIDKVMHEIPLSSVEKSKIDALFNVRNADPDKVLEDAAASLAELTGMAVISATLQHSTVEIKKIEIIPAASRTMVIMMITSTGLVRNKVCRVDFDVTDAIVDFFTKFANATLVGKSVDEITTSYLNSVSVSLGEYAKLFVPMFAALYELVKEIDEGQYVAKGAINLLDYLELSNTSNELLKFLEKKKGVLDVINSNIEKTVYVGRECMTGQLADSSVLVSRFDIGNSATGVLAVIGPVRMNYAELLPRVNYFASTLGRLLNTTYSDEE